MEKIMLIEGMTCPHCAKNVENAIKSAGYKSSVDLAKKTAVVTSRKEIDTALIRAAVENAGYTVTEIK